MKTVFVKTPENCHIITPISKTSFFSLFFFLNSFLTKHIYFIILFLYSRNLNKCLIKKNNTTLRLQFGYKIQWFTNSSLNILCSKHRNIFSASFVLNKFLLSSYTSNGSDINNTRQTFKTRSRTQNTLTNVVYTHTQSANIDRAHFVKRASEREKKRREEKKNTESVDVYVPIIMCVFAWMCWFVPVVWWCVTSRSHLCMGALLSFQKRQIAERAYRAHTSSQMIKPIFRSRTCDSNW